MDYGRMGLDSSQKYVHNVLLLSLFISFFMCDVAKASIHSRNEFQRYDERMNILYSCALGFGDVCVCVLYPRLGGGVPSWPCTM